MFDDNEYIDKHDARTLKKISRKLKYKRYVKLDSWYHSDLFKIDRQLKEFEIKKFKRPTQKRGYINYTMLLHQLEQFKGCHYNVIEAELMKKFNKNKRLLKNELIKMWEYKFDNNGCYLGKRKYRYWALEEIRKNKNKRNIINIDDGIDFYTAKSTKLKKKKTSQYKNIKIKKNKLRIEQKKIKQTKINLLYIP